MAGKTAVTEETMDILNRVKGHDRIVIEHDGKEYTFRYPRSTVRDMERSGVTAQSAAQLLSAGTLIGVEEYIRCFILPGFKTDQPKMSGDDAVGLFEELPDKAEFIQLAASLFSAALTSLTTDPTETRAKFRLV